MKLRNKKTGEKVDLLEIVRLNDISDEFYLRLSDNEGRTFKVGFNSLAGLNEEWEDYEEPKDTNYWCIDSLGKIEFHSTVLDEIDGTPNNSMTRKIIGNYFGTREEARQAAEKLKAVKRLKDKGFRFLGYYHRLGETKSKGEIGFEMVDYEDTKQDLDLLFRGEE